jgi:hypothetical protein
MVQIGFLVAAMDYRRFLPHLAPAFTGRRYRKLNGCRHVDVDMEVRTAGNS